MNILREKITLIVVRLAITYSIVLASCGSDDDDAYWDRAYVFQNDTLQVNMSFDKSGKAYITVYIRGVVAMQDLYAAYTTGEYPALTFTTDYPVKEGLVMRCDFKSVDEYTGTIVSQSLQGNHYEYADRSFTLPRQMHFTTGQGMLDLDGDGYLDDMKH